MSFSLKHRFNAWLMRVMEQWMGKRRLKRFDALAANCNDENRGTLLEILETNKDCEFGKRAGFAELLSQEDTVAAFREAMPLRGYEDYQADVDRMARGETNVLTADDISRYSLSSGTTGKPKIVPVTKPVQVDIVFYMATMLPTRAETEVLARGGEPANYLARDINLISMAGSDQTTEGGAPLGSGSAVGISRMRKWVPYMWTAPVEVFTIEDARTSNYLHALFGLRDRTARKVQSIFAPHMLEWFRSIELWFPALVEDIQNGTLSSSVRLEPALRELLEAQLYADPERAEELREAAKGGFKGCVERFWPSMGLVATCISGSFEQYAEPLRHYTGSVPIYNAMYGASESMVGMGLWLDEENRFVLTTGASFFEFIPVENADEEQPATLLPGELEEGRSYEVVLTNRCGFYRYRLGDVVKCTGRYHEAPVFEFGYRRGTLLDLVGEKTTEVQTRAAVQNWAADWLGQEVVEYTTTLDVTVSPPRYVFYVQLNGDVEDVAKKHLERGAHQLDAALFDANPRYAAIGRRRHRIGPPRLVLVGDKAFEELQHQSMELTGNDNRNQYKTPRMLKNPQLLKLLEDRAVARAEPLSWFMPSTLPENEFDSDAGNSFVA